MINEIKKELYKEKPVATCHLAHNEIYVYETETSSYHVQFIVPVSEMGENRFDEEVPAQLLIRWINKFQPKPINSNYGKLTLSELEKIIREVFEQHPERQIIGYTGCKKHGHINMYDFCNDPECTNCRNREEAFLKELKKQLNIMDFRELRKKMIVLVNTLDKLAEEGNTSRELALSKTSIQKAMMWSGTFLKHSGKGENPYAGNDGNRKSVKDIQPFFDNTTDTLPSEIMSQGLIVIVDSMREYLSKELVAVVQFMNSEEMNDIELDNEFDDTMMQLTIINIVTNLTESRMWLGMELGRIRDSSGK